ncbi:MAG: hypothetical protein H6733_09410 [Alphaproteobacteria bacterium]|nr:hypothetical protein [Alphaproteobacteria bacterium]
MRGLVLLVVAWWVPTPALAWGPDGHRIVCEIAWEAMAPATRHQLGIWLRPPADVRAALGLRRKERVGDLGRYFFDACIWPDTVRDYGSETDFWNDDDVRHYLNAPGDGRDLDAATTSTTLDLPEDCGPRCVTEGIAHYAAILRGDVVDPERPAWAAVRFLGHFVGDLHQPLHAGYGDDRGGNDVLVTVGGRRCWNHPDARCTDGAIDRNNLHGAWDYGLPAALLRARDEDWKTWARVLLDGATPAQRQAGQERDPAVWAQESFALARDVAYRVPDDHEMLGGAYASRAEDVIADRLLVGGLRLAALLDDLAAAQASRPTGT